jgi:Zn-dependent protease
MFGDPTAKLEGRMTINPLAHWDRIGTTLLVVLIFISSFGLSLPVFGWGKPVPIDERNFDNPRWQGFQTAIAGPMSNLILAMILAAITRFGIGSFWESVLYLAIGLNIFLMLFNLIPVPPLDGSRILRLILPEEIYFALVSNPAIYFTLIILVIFFLLTPMSVYAGQVTATLISKGI